MRKAIIPAAAAAIAFAPPLAASGALVAGGVAFAAPASADPMPAGFCHVTATMTEQICQQAWDAMERNSPQIAKSFEDRPPQAPPPPIAGTPGDRCSQYSAPDQVAAHTMCEDAIEHGGQ
jgi:hypothetical protein